MEIRDNSSRARLAIISLWGLLFTSVLAIIAGSIKVYYIVSYLEGELLLPEVSKLILIISTPSRILNLCLIIISIVLFLSWFRRAYGNLHRIATKGLKYSEKMAVWGAIIPILNFFVPYIIAKDIAQKTREKLSELMPEYVTVTKVSVIGYWWGIIIIRHLLGVMTVMPLLFSMEDSMVIVPLLKILMQVVYLIASVLTIVLVKKMSQDETMLYDAALANSREGHNRMSGELYDDVIDA